LLTFRRKSVAEYSEALGKWAIHESKFQDGIRKKLSKGGGLEKVRK